MVTTPVTEEIRLAVVVAAPEGWRVLRGPFGLTAAELVVTVIVAVAETMAGWLTSRR